MGNIGGRGQGRGQAGWGERPQDPRGWQGVRYWSRKEEQERKREYERRVWGGNFDDSDGGDDGDDGPGER